MHALMSRVRDHSGHPPAARRQPGGPAKGDRRRQAILDAIEQLLQERSIAELSVEDIAAGAGISRSGFYFYFESKYAALAHGLGTVGDEMSRAADEFFAGSDDPPEEYVPRALAGVAALFRRHEALLVAIVEAAHNDAGARAKWDAWIERFVAATSERIERERALGRAHNGVAAPDLARVLILMNIGVLYDDRRRRVPVSEDEHTVAALTTTWLGAIWR
jgi:AcrR family transcriptional regulator